MIDSFGKIYLHQKFSQLDSYVSAT